jgi:PKD repeat protein
VNTGSGQTYNIEDFSHTYNAAGSYTPSATVTNTFGCFTSQNLSAITVNQSASLSSPLNPNSICSGSVFNYTPTSSTAGCTYSWTRALVAGISEPASSGNGNISETLTNTTGSNISVIYIVTTTAPNGCQTQQNVIVTVKALPTVSISPANLTICNGSSGTLSATGSPGGGAFSWSNGLGTASTATVSAAGNYSVTYSASGCASAPATASVTLTAAPSVSVSVSENSGTVNNDGTICAGSSVTLTATPSSGGGTYSWSNGATTQSITVNPALTTTYSVTYTLGCPSAIVSTVITVKTLPTNNYVSSVTNACSAPVTTNYTSSATAPSGSTISSTNWTFTSGTPTSGSGSGPISVNYNSSGSYGISMTSISSDGCTSVTNFNNVIVVGNGITPTSSLNVGPTTSLCIGQNFSFQYTGAGADSIRWDYGNGTIAWGTESTIMSYNYSTPGTYTVSMTPYTVVAGSPPQLGCSGSVSTQVITVLGPQASFTTSAVVCSNQFTRTFTNTTSGTTGSTTYSWNFGDGTPLETTQNSTHTFPTTGSFTVTLTATDATTGCPSTSSSATIRVNQNNAADFQSTLSGIVTTSVCIGTTLSFSNITPAPQYNSGSLPSSTSSSNTQWDWNTNPVVANPVTFPNNSASLRGTPRSRAFSSANGYSPGQYGIAMLNIDNNNCRDTIIKPNYITVHGILSNLIVSDTVCSGQAFQPTDNSTAPMSSIASRVWNWGDGTPNTTGNIASPTHTYSNPGTYTLTLTITDNSGLGCSTVVTKTIIVRKPIASFTISEDYICNNQSVTVVNNSTGVGLTTYSWSATNSTPTTGSGINFGSFTFNQQGNQTITLTVTDNLGCSDDSIVPISVFDVFAAAIANPTSFSCFNPPNLVNFTNLSANNVDNNSAQWDFGNGQTSTVWNPSTTYALAGTYNVSLTVSSLTGCTSTQNVATITVGGPSGTLDVTNTNLSGCSCYTASFNVTTGNVTEAKLLYGDGGFVDLVPNSTQNISYSYCNTGTSPVSFTPSLYISNGSCNGFITSNETITINPIPTVSDPTDQTVCATSSVTAVSFTGNI